MMMSKNQYHPIVHATETVNALESKRERQEGAREPFRMNDKIGLVGKLAAGVAHEIRNPLTSIKGFVQLLDTGGNQPEYYSLIYSELNRVEEIINRYMRLAEPHSVKFQFHDVKVILERCMMKLNELAQLKGIEIISCIDSELLPILCDDVQLQQVFENVVKNAIEATSGNQNVHVTCNRMDCHIQIKVYDQGVGIPQERLQRLFEPFYCIKENGTGLGLMESYKIVNEHNGTIQIESEIGTGTTVEINMPLLDSTLLNHRNN